jgi:WD40 repeat protein
MHDHDPDSQAPTRRDLDRDPEGVLTTAGPDGAEAGRLVELFEEWKERYRRGEDASPESLGEGDPPWVEALRERIERQKRLYALLRPSSSEPGATGAVLSAARGKLPTIPGFRIIREVGRGGMGIVYEAEQESLGRRVALKILPDDRLADPQQVRRFEREARSAARLHHTNIVPVFGVGEHDGTHFYVMQFIQGQGLDAVLEELRRLRQDRTTVVIGADPVDQPPSTAGRRAAAEVALSLAVGRYAAGADAETITLDGTLPEWFEPPPDDSGAGPYPPDPGTTSHAAQSGVPHFSANDDGYTRGVARIGRQVAEALAHAHGQGILHRDIKPSNLLLDCQGNAWVADFGLAKAVGADDITHSGDVVGTVRYMAPERFRGEGDARADIYSLGLTLFELLALRPAFEAKDKAELIHQVTQEEPPPLRTLSRNVPSDLVTIVHKAMAREPSQRYATAGELAEDLRRFLEGRPILARRASWPERAWRWCLRNKAVAVLLTTVIILLAAVAGVASLGYIREAVARARAEEAERSAKGEAKRALAAEAKAGEEAERARLAERKMERQWYAASINLMQPAWDAGQIGRLRELLTATETHLDRGFEWSYWQRLCHLERQILVGHRAGVLSVAWSPDGTRLATAGWDMTARVWDAAGREVLALRGHTSGIQAVAWSPDGRRLATASVDGTARVWEASDGHELVPLRGHVAPVLSVDWSPDGLRLVTGGLDGAVKVWDAAGREIGSVPAHDGVVHSVAWSPDGKWLATGGRDKAARVWEAATRRPIRALEGHTGEVWSVAWSPDGTRLASASDDATVKVWDAAAGKELLELKGHTSRVMSVVWSRDGTRLATGSRDGTAKVWDAATGREALAFKGHVYAVNSVAWFPDGKGLATGSEDGTVKTWDAVEGRQFVPLKGHTNGVFSLAWSPDGARLAAGSSDGTTKVWDAAVGREILTLKGHTGRVMSVAWSPVGERLATGSWDRMVRVWDIARPREPSVLDVHVGEVWSVAWSPDGRRLATVGWDRAARVWDADSGHEIFPLDGGLEAFLSVAWSPDGKRLATGGRDRTARVWEAATGREILALDGHGSEVWSVAWSPDGSRLATASQDGTALIWDAAGVGEPLPLKWHAGGVLSVAWSPDGKRLATGSVDRTAKVWDATDGRELLTLKGQGGRVNAVAWSPDGLRLATGNGDGTARLWDAAPTEAIERWARQDRAMLDLEARNVFRGPRATGFLKDWLVLLPVPLDPSEPGAQGLDRQQVPGEAGLRPRPDERATVGGAELAWQAYHSPESVLDLNAVLGRATERSVAYAVCYIESDRARDGLWLQVGSDDQAKAYLNGREIYQCRMPRALEALDTAGPVALSKGTNVLVIKVINEGWNWEACARLVDAEGRPAAGLRVRVSP